ncbi:MAG: hypothetical protein J07HX64_03029 [halophilic archaeon J07HX64]|nr:MAG: hypothetical protein J07HX64_03029 [halophilic archaeon J07HX64]
MPVDSGARNNTLSVDHRTDTLSLDHHTEIIRRVLPATGTGL